MSVRRDDLMLDVSQAAELKMAFRRNGWTNAMIKDLSGGSVLTEVRDFLDFNKMNLKKLRTGLKKPKNESCCCDFDSQEGNDGYIEQISENIVVQKEIDLILTVLENAKKMNQVYLGINYQVLSEEEIKSLDLIIEEIKPIRKRAGRHHELCCCVKNNK